MEERHMQFMVAMMLMTLPLPLLRRRAMPLLSRGGAKVRALSQALPELREDPLSATIALSKAMCGWTRHAPNMSLSGDRLRLKRPRLKR
jgi:hypothetical protein